MFKVLRNAFKIADLRKKILFTLFIILIFRVGSAIPLPFVSLASTGLDTGEGSIISYLSMLTGDAFKYGTLFALGISPYINSSIIMQLLTVAIPPLERLSKEGEEGRKKIAAITRYVTVLLGLLQATAYFFFLRNSGGYLMVNGKALTGGALFFAAVVIILMLTAGTALIMWLGEQVNEKGIGNGISIILFAGIISSLPTAVISMGSSFIEGIKGTEGYTQYLYFVPIVLVIFIAIIGFIVWMDNAERKIPVQYAKKVVGRKVYGGQSTHMPIKVNLSGVLPIIFASSILSLPSTVTMFWKPEAGTFWAGFFNFFNSTSWGYAVLYFVLIILFAYFYASIQYNPIEIANNLRQNSGAIPGIRPGRPTSDYFSKILSRMVLLGALLLSVVAILPIIFSLVTGYNVSLGGTSVLIVVGVALETVKAIESQMMMRHYKGFLD